jgi:hypothetical protein
MRQGNTGINKRILSEDRILFEGKAVKCGIYFAFFIYGLFNDDVSSSDYVVSNVMTIVNSELEGAWKEAVVNYFEALPDICLEGLRRVKEYLSQDNQCGDET